METLYSFILWEKMKKDCKIDEMSFYEIEKEFRKHLEKVGYEKFKKDISEMSFLDIKENELFYEGQFYEFSDSHDPSLMKEDPNDPSRLIVKSIYHETMVEATILTLMLNHLHPETTEFLAKIHKEWFEKKKEKEKGN